MELLADTGSPGSAKNRAGAPRAQVPRRPVLAGWRALRMLTGGHHPVNESAQLPGLRGINQAADNRGTGSMDGIAQPLCTHFATRYFRDHSVPRSPVHPGHRRNRRGLRWPLPPGPDAQVQDLLLKLGACLAAVGPLQNGQRLGY